MNTQQETLHYTYNENWFPENFIAITEAASETIQNLQMTKITMKFKTTMLKINQLLAQTFQRTQVHPWKHPS